MVEEKAIESTIKINNKPEDSWFYGLGTAAIIHISSDVTNPTEAFGTYWNYRQASSQLTVLTDL